MSDLLLVASAPDAGVAIVAGITTQLVRDLQSVHDLTPTASAAVGRLATAAALLGTSLKGDERISLQILGDGPIGGLSAEAWLIDEATVGTRARAHHPEAELPTNGRGKFDVAGIVGKGRLQVTKTYSIGQPYCGVVPLHSGEIAEDVAAYLAFSEQIPSVVALGVLANPAGVAAAGGIIAQVLPGADERAITTLEARAGVLRPITELVADGYDADALLREVAGDIRLRARRELRVTFACLCTRERVAAALMSLDAIERAAMQEDDATEVVCDYCRKKYLFSRADIANLT